MKKILPFLLLLVFAVRGYGQTISATDNSVPPLAATFTLITSGTYATSYSHLEQANYATIANGRNLYEGSDSEGSYRIRWTGTEWWMESKSGLFNPGVTEWDLMYTSTVASTPNPPTTAGGFGNWQVNSAWQALYPGPPLAVAITGTGTQNTLVIATAPVLTTNTTTGITSTAATFNAEVTSDGGATLTDKGFLYSDFVTTPTVGAGGVYQITKLPYLTGIYSHTIAGLTPSTTYYVRAYAINSAGTSYGTTQIFNTLTTPTISASATLSSMSSTYGASSVAQTFTVSGTNMAAGVLVTAPTGFEVSADGVTYSGSTTVGAAGTFSATTVYVRLAGNVAATTYSGNIALSSSGAANINVPTVLSTVNPAPLTITANNQTKAYGAAVPTLTASYTGFVNGDTPVNLTTPPTLSTTATAASSVAGGPYAITASGAVNSNYTISYVPGTLTVNPVALIITASNQTKAYGAAIPTVTASYTGFVNGDTPVNLTTPPTLSTTATAASSVAGSPYPITPSGAVNANYTISYVGGTLTVTPVALTITANNQSKAYGAVVPTLTASYTGFVNGDTNASLTTQPTLTTTANAASSVAGSPYAITASGAADANYTISYVPGTLTINPVTLTITADNKSKNYGAAVPALTASYTGFVNGDTNASLTTQPTLSTTGTAASSVAGSPYPITASGAVNSNYAINYAPGTLTVNAVALTITADNKTKAYGAAVPALTASYSGFVNGDTNASLTTQPTLSTTGTAASSVAGSPYPITASGAVNSNYAINYAPGTLTVNAVALTITADNKTKAYGAAVPALTASYSGFVNGDTNASLTTQPTLSTTGTAASSVAGSPYPITATGAVNSNYTISYAPGTLTINPVTLTITADNKSKNYGATVPALTASYSGFVNGDTNASLTTQPTLSTTGTAASSVAGSPYPITAAGAVNSNYAINYAPGTLTVNAVALTITTDNKTKAYGAAVPALTASYSGFVNGDTNASLTTQPTLSTTGTAASSVAGSPYPITASGAVNSNYTISYAPGTLTVNAVALTITADNKTKAYGAAVPALTASYSGFVNGDTNASLTTQPTLSTSGTAASSVAGSPYPITATGAVNSNYTISYSPGTLTISPTALTVAANNVTKVYGQALSGGANSTAFTQTGLIGTETIGSVSITYGTGAAANAAIGNYTGTVSASAATGGTFTPGNYTIVYTPGNIIITTRTISVTADAKSKVYGDADPALTYVITSGALVGSDTFTGSLNRDAGESAANYQIKQNTLTLSSNYVLTYVGANLVIGKKSLTATANNQSRPFAAANPALTFVYAGFAGTDNGASLTTQPTASTTANALSLPGNYPIKLSGGVSGNYNFNYVDGSLTITPLTITNLSSLLISSGTLSSLFNTGIFSYTASVSNSVDNIRFTATFDPTATLKIDGSSVTNGGTSANIPLNVGNNQINVVVTAQDGVTKSNYLVTVYRGAAPATITATNILSPNGDGKNDNWVVQDILLYPQNSVTVYDRAGRIVYSKKGYTNDWDGTLKGAPLNEGTYFYNIDLGPGLPKFRGFITLLRSN